MRYLCGFKCLRNLNESVFEVARVVVNRAELAEQFRPCRGTSSARHKNPLKALF